MSRNLSVVRAVVLASLFLGTACTETEGPSGGGGGGGGGSAIIRGGDPTESTVNSAGPYRVATYGLFGKGGVRDGAEYADFEIYYPEGATAPFSIVSIVPGFISDRSWVGDWAPFVASHGIAAILIDTNWLTDDPDARKAALLDALVSLKAENTRAGSPLQGKLDTSRAGVIGWSMGGGGALLAGAEDPSLKAVVALCPWNILSLVYAGLRVPALQFGATGDIVAGSGMTYDFYNAIPSSTPKILFNLSGGDHWYANSPSGHWNAVGRFGISFLKTFLDGDARYRKFLTVEPLSMDDFRHNL